jgi:hypothetical protein
MIEIPLCVYVGFKIMELARRKGKSVTPWVIIGILSFFAAYIIGMTILLVLFYKGGLQQNEVMKFFQNPMRLVFVWVSAFGGYLLVRRVLERMPDIKKPK